MFAKYRRVIKIMLDLIHGEKFIGLSDNEKIFYRKTEHVNEFLKNPPKEDFILVSHNSDGKILDYDTQFGANVNYIPNNLIKWYGQNVCINHEKVKSIPIGLENTIWFPEIRKYDKISQIVTEKKNIRNLLYVNHNINTNPIEREKPYEIFRNKSWVTLINGSNGFNFNDYLNNIYNHKFVLCPEGNGTDTHRTWETLYLNTIPIEKRNVNNQFYTDLPICFVDDWDEINEIFLENEHERITRLKWNNNKLKFSYWESLIKTGN